MSIHKLYSPNGRVLMTVSLESGALFFETRKDGILTCAHSPLGLVTDRCVWTTGMTLIDEKRSTLDEYYQIAAFKKSHCRDYANTMTLSLDRDGQRLQVETRAYDDGAAVRLRVPGSEDIAILDETTAFSIPQDAGQLYAQRYLFTYEDHYHPIPREDWHQNPLAFPLLLDAGHGVWALYAEAAVFGDYGGGHLRSEAEHPARLIVRKSPDQLSPIQAKTPLQTPWRVILMGSLNDIVSSNTIENLNPPSIVDDPSFIRPGLCAWSWMTENASTRDIDRIHDYVDYAAAMGFPYYLADGGWPGHIDIPELVRYAAGKEVQIWLWEHSAHMRDPAEAEAKMKLWSSWGIVGLKIDFFESDRPERMAQYDMLAEKAARYRLMLNFHGAAKPAGESRTWPHVLTREGVMGGEYLQNFSTYLPGGPDAAHHCTLPFTRNATGPMDFTPVVYKTYLTGTTDCHQTALAVIFLSYIQHIGECAEVIMDHVTRPFLSALPADWDEGLLLEGYPANHVTMARRKGETWFVGGICARRARNARVDLAFLSDGEHEMTLYQDDLGDLQPFDAATGALPPPTEADYRWIDQQMQRPTAHQHDLHTVSVTTKTVQRGDVLTIPMSVNGGFVMMIR